jgi:hypothetical protein
MVYDSPPFHFGMSKIDEQGETKPGSLQVVDALGQVLSRELVDAFNFHQ